MLIVTDEHMYTLGRSGPADEPMVRLVAEGLRCAVEGADFEVVALADGRVMFMRGELADELGQLTERITSMVLLSPDRPELLVGTEPPHLFRVGPGQAPARVESFERLEDRPNWSTPWGGPPAVRSLARAANGWVYADIHSGGVMRSSDDGATWEAALQGLARDVHQVACSQADPRRVYANTDRGVYVSDDHGGSWQHRAADLDERYGRAIAPHPIDADCMLASVSDGPHGENVHAQLYRTEDAGRSWRLVEGDFPQTAAANIDTFHVAFAPDGRAWACVEDMLYIGTEKGRLWQPVWSAREPIRMIVAGEAR